MTVVRTALNAKESREYFDPVGPFAAKHQRAFHILLDLRSRDFRIFEVRPGQHEVQIRLGCGAQILVYQRTGTVMVQGKLLDWYGRESEAMLREVLPEATVWQVRTQ